MKRVDAQWRDPTGDDAVFNIDRSNQPVSITEHRDVQPLSKFEDNSKRRGRRRLLSALQDELNRIPRTNSEARKKLGKEIAKLSEQQYTSRVSPEEIVRFRRRKKR